MEITKIIAELRREQAKLDDAILALERLAANRGKRRGRPPKWLAAANDALAEKAHAGERKKRTVSAEARQRMAEAQRKRWMASKGKSAILDSQ